MLGIVLPMSSTDALAPDLMLVPWQCSCPLLTHTVSMKNESNAKKLMELSQKTKTKKDYKRSQYALQLAGIFSLGCSPTRLHSSCCIKPIKDTQRLGSLSLCSQRKPPSHHKPFLLSRPHEPDLVSPQSSGHSPAPLTHKLWQSL